MKPEIILWIQGKSVEDDNILSYNGKRIDKNSSEYMSLYAKTESKEECKQIIKKDNLTVYKGNNYYLIYSNYKEVDVVGRRVGFMSYIKENDLKNALSYLKEESKLYDYNCYEDDIIEIENYKPFPLKEVVAGIIVVVGILYLLLK